MEIFSELNFNPELVLALGFFDGVHLGHQKVIKSAVDFARGHGVPSGILTFVDHPCCYFKGVCPKYILQRNDRIDAFADLGVDYLYMLPFDEGMAKMPAKEYLEKNIIHKFFPTGIFTGFNHYFGAKKVGNPAYLTMMQEVYHYKYVQIEPQEIDDEVISSTNIRNLISGGNLEKANRMLGYKFFVKGEVIEGNKIGRTIGFRTANLNYPPELIDIPFGVYKVVAEVGGEDYYGMANFGLRPTINDGHKPVLEVHIKGFDRDIYGENIKVQFVKKIRDEKKFGSLEELKEQIKKDLELC